ncbi:MAG TPA: DUF3027 domain-containing protein [Mycobacteriales bacterium]|nr:DUF3027 domain-containing protein [Mycobacteriales bacterium]
MSATTSAATLDSVAAAAADVARAAAEEAAPGLVGEYVGASYDDERVVTHRFATLDPSYRGWCWAVTVARAPRAKSVTVDDIVLLPGDDALLAPEWVPWSERLRPGDLRAGDLLPTAPDDSRLVPTFFSTDDEDEHAVVFELGLGRTRVLSYDGQWAAVERWYSGDPGPQSAVARAAPAGCASCGFFVPLAGGLRQAFGVCANELAPDDGKVVSVDHGCGAHSEAAVVPASEPPPPPLVDDVGYDVVPVTPGEDADIAEVEVADIETGGVHLRRTPHGPEVIDVEESEPELDDEAEPDLSAPAGAIAPPGADKSEQ